MKYEIIECVTLFQSERLEAFYDIQLDVKGCRNVKASFEKYIEAEMLDGENQYDVGEKLATMPKGQVCDASSRAAPAIKVIEYDYVKDCTLKINDRAIWAKVEVRPIRGQQGGQRQREDSKHDYLLHSILIHSGDIIGGHYYCFVRLPPGMEPCLTKREPTDTTGDDEKTEDEEGGEDAVSGMDEEDESGEESEGSHEDEANKPPKNHTDRYGWKWYKFDDDIVTKVRPEEALGDAFGGAWGEVYSDSGGDTSSEGGSGDERDAVYETGDGDTLKRKVVGGETEGGDRPGSNKRRKFEAKKKTSIVGDWKRQKTSNAYMLVRQGKRAGDHNGRYQCLGHPKTFVGAVQN